jgi:hypothetical protein
MTLGILVCGVMLMARGGETNKKYSNKMMIARVIFQALTIVAIGLMYYIKHH